jgi:hypothetical protein
MKRKTLINLSMVLGLAVALGGSVALARQPHAQAPSTQETLSPQADVGTGFTYQGRLVDNGTPVDGTCDFRFNLYDDQWISPSLIAGPVDRGSVAVNNGYFSTGLDFGANAFTGGGRQLEILVRCPAGSGSYTTLSGMVPLNPAPYAHSLRPGAVISGDLAGVTGPNAALYIENTYGGMWASYGLQAKATNGTGVYGESLSSTGIGVEGKAASTGKGVRGETFSGYGVYGEATGGSGVTYGVYGKTNSPSGYAVYAEGRAFVDDELYVNGELWSDGNFYGLSNAEVDGDVTVHGDLTWDAKTSYVSVPAAAFHPTEDGYDFSNGGSSLSNQDGMSDWYVASVQLPHGATVTKLTFYWTDYSDSNGSCGLWKHCFAEDAMIYALMASAETFGDAGYNASIDSTVDMAEVDNSQCTFALSLDLPETGIEAYGVFIEYTITGPY